MSRKTIILIAVALLAGWCTGFVLSFFPVPLPYLLGALLANAVAIFVLPKPLIAGVTIPDTVRHPFIACIGLLIGAQVHLELIANWSAVLILLILITVFTPLALALNIVIFRRFAGYDRPTAYFSAAPGGLIEAIEFGTQAGANVAILSMQQFLRIVFVVTLVPFAMSIWQGHPVGSAAGLSAAAPSDITPLWIVLIVGLAGYLLGRLKALPAGQLTGPLIVAAVLSSTGVLHLQLPGWLIIAAQVVIGAALGLRFNGLSLAVLRRGVMLGLISVTAMLTLGALLAWILTLIVPLSSKAAFLSFAPGGVTEMALVALSIAADPAIVTLAHVYRIVLTVVLLSLLLRRLRPPPFPPA